MREKVNIAVLVSGGGTNLQALIDAEQSGALHSGRIALAISNNPDAYALTRAEQANLPALTIPRGEDFEPRLQRELEQYSIGLIILAGFMTILSKDFTLRWPRRILNVHPALIPSFCGKGMYGLRVHQAALERGVKVTGATVHFVNEIPDGGEILLQKAVDVLPGDTPEILQKRVMEHAEWLLLPQAAELVSASILHEKEAYI